MSRERLWAFLAVGLPVLGATLATMSTVDLAYQVQAGDLMRASGAVLRTDPFTFTAGGDAWLNQQWGAGLVLAIAYGPAGWAGLAALRAALIGLVFGLVYVAARSGGAGTRTAALLALAGFAVGLPALALRAQLFGMVAFAIVLTLLAARVRRPSLVWAIPFVVVAWANLHGSFFLGPAAVGVALLDDALRRRPGSGRLAAVLGLSLLATVVSPFGTATWTYALGLATNADLARLVTEWQHTSPFAVTGILFYLSVAAAALLGAGAWRRGWRPGWPTVAWLVAMAALGAWAERGTAWWAIAAPVALAPAAVAIMARRSAGEPAVRPAGSVEGEGPASAVLPVATAPPIASESPVLRVANAAIVSLIVLAIVVLQPAWRASDPVTGPAGLLTDAPGPLAAAIRENAGPADRLFDPQRWGSWLEWAAPGVPLMVDSRIEVVPGPAWDDYQAISAGSADWRDRLDRLGVTVLIAGREDQAALLPALAADPAWRRIYQDVDAEVYVRAP